MFLEKQSKNFKKVFLITGNREYYSPPINAMNFVDDYIEQLCNKFPNIYFLNRKSVDITDKIRIAGKLGNINKKRMYFMIKNYTFYS